MSRVVYIREKAPNQQHGGNKGVEDINTVLGKKYDEISELYTLPGRRHLFDYARSFTRNWSNLNTIRKSVKNDDIDNLLAEIRENSLVTQARWLFGSLVG